MTWERLNPLSLRRKQLWKISRDELFKVRLRLPIARVSVDQVTRSHYTQPWPGPHCDSFRRRSPLECRRCCLSEDFYEYLLKGHNAIISHVTSCLAEMFHLSNWIDKGPVIFRWIRTRFRNWHIYFKEGISCQIGEIVAWIENCHTGEGKFNKTLPRAQRTQALSALTLTFFNFSFIITQLSLSTQSRRSSRSHCVELPVSMGGGGSST